MMHQSEIRIAQSREALSGVLWIGGATDSGKTTVARLVAERHNLALYNYDRTDVPHHDKLAARNPEIQAFLSASIEERWVLPEPRQLFDRAIRSFYSRWPLVLEDLLALLQENSGTEVIAEGFGLLPDLVGPVIQSERQAIWLVPTEQFKVASFNRRRKPSFAAETSDPKRARGNLLKRDMMLAEYIAASARALGLTVYEVDGTRSAEEMAGLVEEHFAPLLPRR